MYKILILFLLPVFSLATQLSELLNALNSSTPVKIKEYDVKRANLAKEALARSYMPSLSIESGYSSYSDDMGFSTPKESLKAALKLEFMLYDGGAREARLDALKFNKNAQELRSSEFKNELAYECIALYFTALNLNEILEAKNAQVKYLLEAKNRLDGFMRAGLASIDESEAVKAQYLLALSELDEIKTRLENVLLQIELLTDIKDIKPQKSKIDDVNFNTLSQNGEILALKQELNSALSGEKEAFSSYLPQIFLQNRYLIYKNNYDYGYLSSNSKAFSPYLKELLNEKKQDTNEFMIGFSWKIFDFGSSYKQIQISRIKTQQLALNLAYKQSQNITELKSIQNEIKSLKSRIKALEASKQAALKSLEVNAQKYKAGLVGYSEFLAATSRSFEASSNLSVSQNELEIKKARYFYKNGDDIASKVVK
ncbi:TolC family protein [Campylobacter mucosalis]|uniref:TolC family protein n=1 Tax=Campylobacter mucosalis TaxID=202 RepID=UPI00147063DD|nr:TolC family protein [Campylobacter mucosalis]